MKNLNLPPAKKYLLAGGATLLLVIICVFILVRNKSKSEVDTAFSQYIESYTSGVISKESVIRVKLSNQIQVGHSKNELLGTDILDFSPTVKGKTYWIDAQTIEFKPDAKLKPGTKYEVAFNLAKITSVPDEFKEFNFEFETISPDFMVSFNGLRTASNNSLDKMKLTGIISTADVEDAALIEKILSVSYTSDVRILWQHDASSKSYLFTINDIPRSASGSELIQVKWDGSPLDIERKDSKDFEIPAIGDFKVLEVKSIDEDDQYIHIFFSNPIKIGQELNGLISISDQAEPAYTIDGSTVKLFPENKLEGNYTVFVNEGVQDITGKKVKPYTSNVFTENRLPSVSIPGRGVILPGSGKLMMPFEAVNLNAVDVTIIRVYENNVPQYFQNNGFDGSYELRRVAKPVVQKTIRLDIDKTLNLSKKNRFMLDVDKMMRAEPGALYRIVIGFRNTYSLFDCSLPAVIEDKENEEEGYGEDYGYYDDGIHDEDDEFWQRYDNYYPQGYTWKDRDDPCSISYYTKQRWATRNIIASNIGLVTKRGSDNSMLIAVTNILTAQPMAGVDLELLDYQRQVLLRTRSDADGLANFTLKRRPYLLVAKNGDERGYLKLDDGSSLPLSRFDVGGGQVQNGLKGFIYAERGVWRPGDSIFVSFILEDKLKTLPKEHPVEFELFNPKGQLYQRITRTGSLDGFYSFHTGTSEDAPTGNWRAKIKVGGALFEKNIRVETIMPNRLKVNLSFGNQTELTKGSNTNGALSAQWLFGGKAQNLKAKVDAFISAQNTVFKNFKNYVFDDPTRAMTAQTQTIFESKLDANGNAVVNADINVDKQAPGMLKANFLVKVFEPGGNFSINQLSLPYHVYSSYIGMRVPQGSEFTGMLPTGKDNLIDIANVDTKGNLVAGARKVNVQVYKIQWRWWWDQTGNELSNFTQDQYNKLISDVSITLQSGVGKYKFRVNNENWGRYLIKVTDPQTGHSTGKIVYADWPNWAERLQQGNSTEAAMLSFTSDKKNYKVGEQATVTIPTGAEGRALISFENGSKILKTAWIDTKKGQTQYRFNVEADMAPNIFVNVTLLQRHSQTLNDLPIRMYGAIPLKVDNPQTILKPVISMPDKIRPETASQITVSEASGREMTYTIAIVDEGLLDLTNFKTPDPHAAFYAHEALGVKTWDLFDYVLGAYGAGLERILSIGGDMTSLNNKNLSANRFKPVVKFLGPFHLNAGEKQTKRFTLPQYVGSVRAMVIAGHEGSYGFTEKAVAVKKPLMILATLPRVLGPSEKVQLPVNVFAMESNIKTVSVEVQSDVFSNLTGNNKKTLTFASPGDQIISFDLNVKDFTGKGKVRIVARSGSETASYDVELNVRNPNPPLTKILEKEIRPGETWSADYSAIGMSGTNKSTLEVSVIPALNLSKRLDYLVQYPHGCVEQATSAVFPQLYMSQLMDLSTRQKAEIERNIKLGISRLNGFQVPGGGLSYWPGMGEPDEWGTSYAGHFMLAAQAKGYNIPVGFIEQWKKYQKQKALEWMPDTKSFYGSDLIQAYRLYLLALARAPELGAMNRLKEFKYLSVEAKWRLAAAYKLAGQPEAGLQMISGLPTDIKPYNQMFGTYGSDLRDEAMILETLTLLGQPQKAMGMVHKIAARLSEDNWYSTQTTAYSLLAIAQYCGENRSSSKLIFNYQAGSQKASVSSPSYLWQSLLSSNSGKAVIKNGGSNVLYVRLIQKGQPSTGQSVETKINPDVLDMRVAYTTLGGQLIDISKIRQGTDFVAQVTIKNPGKRGRYDNMALTQIFPSGWEIINTRLMNNEEVFNSSPADYRDVRDDRVNTYFDLPEGKEVRYYVMLNAAYTGRYYLPPVSAEAMYNSTISAFKKGQWVEVFK